MNPEENPRLNSTLLAAIGKARKDLIELSPGAWTKAAEKYFLFAGRHPSRVIANGLWITDDFSPERDFLEEVTRTFADKGHDFSIYVPASFPLAEASLLKSSFRRRIIFPAMQLDLTTMVVKSNPDVDIRPMRAASELEEFIVLCQKSFEFSSHTSGLCRSLLTHVTPAPGRDVLLLRKNGVAAACAMTVRVDDHTIIDWVATHPDFRRKGLGQTITVAALHLGLELGATSAGLHSSAMAYELYRKIGFSEFGKIALYSPAPSESP